MNNKLKFIIIGGFFFVIFLAVLTTYLQRRIQSPSEPQEEVFVLNEEEGLSITSISPSSSEHGVRAQTTIVVTFSRQLSSTEQKNTTFRLSPSVDGSVAFFDGGRILRFTPRSPLNVSTKYEASLSYSRSPFVWSFTTSPSATLSRDDILRMYPWYESLPLVTERYTVAFDVNEKKFKGIIYSEPDEEEDIREEILTALRRNNVGVDRYPLELQRQNPPEAYSSQLPKVITRTDLPKNVVSKINGLLPLLPYETDDFDIDYHSRYIEEDISHFEVTKLIAIRKRAQADEKITEWLTKNKLAELDGLSSFFTIIDGPPEELANTGEYDLQRQGEVAEDFFGIFLNPDINTDINFGEEASPAGSLSQDVSASKEELLENSKFIPTSAARTGLESGIMDSRLVSTLNIVAKNYSIDMVIFKKGKSPYDGLSANIFAIDDLYVNSTTQNLPAKEVVDLIISLDQSIRPDNLGQPFYGKADDPKNGVNVTTEGYNNHLHIEFEKIN